MTVSGTRISFPDSEEFALRKAAKQSGLGIAIKPAVGRGRFATGKFIWLSLTEDRNYAPFWKAWRKARGDE